tara:strand:- start:246 stop:941 length:696 start_codon:yes stop_codon:yes gene_type:complete
MLGLSNSITSGSPSYSAFSITSISNLEVWLKFNTGQGAITGGIQWQDQSGNANDAAQTADVQEGSFSGGAFVTDAGANDNLDFDSQIDLARYHVFVVLNLSEQTNEGVLSSTDSSTSFMRLGQGSTTKFRLRHNTSSNQVDITLSEAFGTSKAIFEVKRDGSNNVVIAKNGSSIGDASSAAGTFELNQISAHSNGLSSAEIHEVVVFSNNLPDSDSTLVRNDIATRNSITL